jgi:hypothetical protein
MRDDTSSDPAVLLLSALADQIADRLASRLAPHLAEIVEAGALELSSLPDRSEPGDARTTGVDRGLWTAGRVAAHYNVAVRFIYQHADELGCVRLGGGPRPRLRFDPDIVRARWPLVGDTPPPPGPIRRRSARSQKVRHGPGRSSFELLDFDREP